MKNSKSLVNAIDFIIANGVKPYVKLPSPNEFIVPKM